jgi:O-antigen ligase
MNTLTQKFARSGSPLLVLFAFSLPLSTSAGSILAMLLILAALLSVNRKAAFAEAFSNPVVITIFIYITLHIFGLLWTQDMPMGFEFVERQWKLLLLPVFMTLVKKEHTSYYLWAFVFAIFLKACKAYLVWLGIITLPPSSIFTTMGTSHVIYNPMLALACYIVLQHLLFNEPKIPAKIVQLGLFIFLSCNMFITVGRTGQIAFFVFLVVIVFQTFFTLSKVKFMAGLLCIPLLILATYQYSPTFKERAQLAVNEVLHYESRELTSMGLRVWFLKNSAEIIAKSWRTGVGTGDFPMEYEKINRVNSPTLPATDNPHNQYVLVLIQFGVVGVISLIAIFCSQVNLAFVWAKDSLTPLRQAFPIFFLVIMLAESYLQIYATGFLFSLFGSFLYKDFTGRQVTET